MARSRLHQLSEHGVSVWVDSLSREMLDTGHLARLIDEDAVVGVTSNPTIFQKALAEGDWYDEQVQELAGEGQDDPEVIFRMLAVRDIQDACDLMRPVWDETGGGDGYVSLEVNPKLAHETEATAERAKLLWRLVDRSNAFIKIPATRAGLPA